MRPCQIIGWAALNGNGNAHYEICCCDRTRTQNEPGTGHQMSGRIWKLLAKSCIHILMYHLWEGVRDRQRERGRDIPAKLNNCRGCLVSACGCNFNWNLLIYSWINAHCNCQCKRINVVIHLDIHSATLPPSWLPDWIILWWRWKFAA